MNSISGATDLGAALSHPYVLLCSVLCLCASPLLKGPRPKVIELDSGGKDYLQVLAGPPESVKMKSGLVMLPPNKSVGEHTTGQYEELLVVLEGQGEMSFKDGSKLDVRANHALYCPPETEHNVTNTGTTVLRYIYVVASTK
ncbi:MAG TPA: cupin domain-containing protein [Methylomirabilota bacterium]|nr:cupin domain-containing protein [Methylomirabilota bacterium]